MDKKELEKLTKKELIELLIKTKTDYMELIAQMRRNLK